MAKRLHDLSCSALSSSGWLHRVGFWWFSVHDCQRGNELMGGWVRAALTLMYYGGRYSRLQFGKKASKEEIQTRFIGNSL